MAEITVIVTAHNRGGKYALLNTLVSSFVAQTFADWQMIVLHDGMERELDPFVKSWEHETRVCIEKFPKGPGDWGHSLRSEGLGMVVTPWIMWTNDDNYYAPVFLERMLKAGKDHDPDMVVCDMIHNQRGYRPISTRLYRGHIDIGCFIVRTDKAKRTGFNHRDYAADWHFVEDFVDQHSARVAKVEQVLYVHN